MARPRGYKRLTRKARHIIRHLPRIKFAAVQDQAIHELKHEVSRTHGFKGPGKAPDRSKAGHWRPLTRKAKQMLTRLRKAKVWSMQKQLVNELAREMERGRRLADRARVRAQAAATRVRSGADRTRRAGSRFRKAASRGQERLLARAERKQAGRDKNPRARRYRLRIAAGAALSRMRKPAARRKAPVRPAPRSVAARVNASRTRFDKQHVRYVNQAGGRTPGQPVFRRTRTRIPRTPRPARTR